MTISFAETSYGRIEYSVLGHGKPILVIHGGHVNCRETIFQKGLERDKFCFITPSRPGYGNTPLTDFTKTPKEAADLIVELLDRLKVSKATVIGVSAGGLTALEIAARHADRVERLVLISALTKKWFNEDDKVYKGGKKLFAPAIERYTWLLYRWWFRLFPKMMTRIMFKELSKYRPVEFTEDEAKELKQLTLHMRSGHGFANDLDQTIDQETLLKVACPTLILHSEYDNAVDISHALNAEDKIKNSKLVFFKNRWGHLLWIGKEYEIVLKALKQQIHL